MESPSKKSVSFYKRVLAAQQKGRYEEAKRLLVEGADSEDAECIAHLGYYYLRGIWFGIAAADWNTAMQLLVKAAKMGNAKAMAWIAYDTMCRGIKNTSNHWGVNALAKSDNYAKGLCHQYGLGTCADPEHAAIRYLQAAESGDMMAQFQLGMCWKNGIGVFVSPYQSLSWISKSADQGYHEAQYRLGEYYEKEEENYPEAMEWYRRAMIQGYWDARRQYDGLYARGYRLKWSIQTHDVFHHAFKAAQFTFLLCLKRNGFTLPKDLRKMIIGIISQIY